MGWDEQRGRTVEQRAKETSEDYRYFPEPDLPPLRVSRAWVDEIRASLPELPDAKRDRFVTQYDLPLGDAAILTADYDVACFFEEAVTAGRERRIAPKTMGNWVLAELFRLLRAEGVDITGSRVTPVALAQLVILVEEGTITANTGKAVLDKMFATGCPPDEIVAQEGLTQISDKDELVQIVGDIIAASPEEVAKYQAGKETLLGWFVGQVMRATRGKANPQMVRSLLEERLRG
jgi:aspartyl-tRNA(Asn)/glutamyl-tRNA(Gln) amidotransferase subunit B